MKYIHLEKINNPSDIKLLPRRELPRLAEEIRHYISSVVHDTGGHLASNLGVVELTIALHYVFDLLDDRLIWDVSHQIYTHKILSGRREAFRTLRTRGGISGFSNPEESDCDPFVAGHAGASISTALGIAAGDAIAGRDRKVIAVIGDGSLGSGMAFEALNNASNVAKNLIVILNDNEMSISPTVGALSAYFNRLRFSSIYTDLKKDVRGLVRSLPLVGSQVDNALERALEALRSSVLPGHLFEELGFDYYGPFNGHDLDLLVQVLGKAKKATGLEIIHLITKKGKGFEEAEQNPTEFHSASNFLPSSTNKFVPPESRHKKPSYTAGFGGAIVRLAKEYPKVVAITAAMPDGTGLVDFQERFPARYFDVGICEQHALGLAAGLFKSGYFPVFAVYSTFLQRGYDQLFHEIALNKIPCLICIDRGGLVGEDGPTHHGVFDIAYMRTLPGFALAAPANCSHIFPLMKMAVDRGLSLAIRYPRAACPDEGSGENAEFALGKGEVLVKGADAAVLAYGAEVSAALEAAKLLEKKGKKITVADARFAKPLDTEMILKLYKSHKHLVTVEEHALAGGFGSAVIEMLSDRGLDTRKVHRIGIPDEFVEHAPRSALLAMLSLDAEGIAGFIKSLH